MLGRGVTSERRAQLAHEALLAIKEHRARVVLLELRGSLGLLDRLALKVSKAFLVWWERREQRVLKELRGL